MCLFSLNVVYRKSVRKSTDVLDRHVGGILDLVPEFAAGQEKLMPKNATRMPCRQRCFLAGNDQYVFSGSRRIRIFEKILRIQRAASILVQAGDFWLV